MTAPNLETSHLRQIIGVSEAADAYISASTQPDGLLLIASTDPEARELLLDATIAHHAALYGIRTATLPSPGSDLPFSRELRAALRVDYDVIGIHSLEDDAAWKLSVTASLCGHLVIATCEGSSAAEAATKPWRDHGVATAELALVFAGAIALRVESRLCPHCRQKAPTPDTWPSLVPRPDTVFHPNPQGCAHCEEGIIGSVLLSEFLRPGPDVKEAIKEGATAAEIQELVAHGPGGSLNDAACHAAANGVIDARVLTPASGPHQNLA